MPEKNDITRIASATGLPPVLFAAVARKTLARALRRGVLRRKKGRPIRLHPSRERAARARPRRVVVRVDVVAASAGGVRVARRRRELSVAEVPVHFLSCSRLPDSAGGVRSVEAAGGVIVREGPEPRVLVLHKIEGKRGRWVLPKGKRRPAEDEVEAAVREVVEETGLERLAVDAFLAREKYFSTAGGACEFKRVAYYLMRCPANASRARVRLEEGFAGAAWMTFDEALSVTSPLRAHRALKKASELLAKGA